MPFFHTVCSQVTIMFGIFAACVHVHIKKARLFTKEELDYKRKMSSFYSATEVEGEAK